MHIHRVLIISTIAVMTLAIGLDARSKRATTDSHWRTSDIVIDGAATDWPGPLVAFNDQPVSIAAANDGQFLYFVLTTSEQSTRMQIMRQGLVVWIDGSGGDKKHFGIKYPVGGDGPEGTRGHRSYGGGSSGGGSYGGGGSQDDPQQSQTPAPSAPNEPPN